MQSPRDRLSSDPRRDVYDLLVQGLSNEEISKELGMTVRTVKYHVTQVLRETKLVRRGDVIAAHGRFVTNGQAVVGMRDQLDSERRKQVYDLIVKGTSYREAARGLNISERTVKFHAHGLINDLGVGTQAKLIAAHWGIGGRAAIRRGTGERRGTGDDILGVLVSAIEEARTERNRLDHIIEQLECVVNVLET